MQVAHRCCWIVELLGLRAREQEAGGLAEEFRGGRLWPQASANAGIEDDRVADILSDHAAFGNDGGEKCIRSFAVSVQVECVHPIATFELVQSRAGKSVLVIAKKATLHRRSRECCRVLSEIAADRRDGTNHEGFAIRELRQSRGEDADPITVWLLVRGTAEFAKKIAVDTVGLAVRPVWFCDANRT